VSGGAEEQVVREIKGGGDVGRWKAKMSLTRERLEQYKARLVQPSGWRMWFGWTVSSHTVKINTILACLHVLLEQSIFA
jgi:hypothetical protein